MSLPSLWRRHTSNNGVPVRVVADRATSLVRLESVHAYTLVRAAPRTLSKIISDCHVPRHHGVGTCLGGSNPLPWPQPPKFAEPTPKVKKRNFAPVHGLGLRVSLGFAEDSLKKEPTVTLEQQYRYVERARGVSAGEAIFGDLSRLMGSSQKKERRGCERDGFSRAVWRAVVAGRVETGRFEFVERE